MFLYTNTDKRTTLIFFQFQGIAFKEEVICVYQTWSINYMAEPNFFTLNLHSWFFLIEILIIFLNILIKPEVSITHSSVILTKS